MGNIKLNIIKTTVGTINKHTLLIAMDNSPQGIHNIGDIKKAIEQK